jgi:hypothetical protein
MRELFSDLQFDNSTGTILPSVLPRTVCVDFELMLWDNNPEMKDSPALLYMREVGGSRYSCTRIDGWAWSALTRQFQQQKEMRPVTHEGWAETIKELGGQLQDVVVDNLDEDRRFRAKLRIIHNHQFVTMDVRATDAYVLAVVFGVPVLVADKLMGKIPVR